MHLVCDDFNLVIVDNQTQMHESANGSARNSKCPKGAKEREIWHLYIEGEHRKSGLSAGMMTTVIDVSEALVPKTAGGQM